LHCLGDKVSDAALMSSSDQIERGIPRSKWEIPESDPSQFPMQKPIKKLEGDIQCSGEAKYIDDTEVMKLCYKCIKMSE